MCLFSSWARGRIASSYPFGLYVPMWFSLANKMLMEGMHFHFWVEVPRARHHFTTSSFLLPWGWATFWRVAPSKDDRDQIFQPTHAVSARNQPCWLMLLRAWLSTNALWICWKKHINARYYYSFLQNWQLENRPQKEVKSSSSVRARISRISPRRRSEWLLADQLTLLQGWTPWRHRTALHHPYQGCLIYSKRDVIWSSLFQGA